MTGVFNEFCLAWRQKFPGETLPGVWEEDIRANLVKHRQKLEALKLEIDKEEFYVKFLENFLTDVNNRKQSSSAPVQLTDAATAGARTGDTPDEAEKPDFVTVISITSKIQQETNQLQQIIDKPRAPPPKPPPKNYSRSFSVDSTPKNEDLVAWTKQQIAQLHTKQLAKPAERESPPNLPGFTTNNSPSNSEGSEKNDSPQTTKPLKSSANYENVNIRKSNYENVFDDFPSR